MKQFKNIFAFEFLGLVKNKIFVSLTLIIVLVMGIVLFSPRFKSGDDNKPGFGIGPSYAQAVTVKNESGTDITKALTYLQSSFGAENVYTTDETRDELEKKVNDDELEIAVIITSPLSYDYIVKTAGMTDMTTVEVDNALLFSYQDSVMKSAGLSDEQINSIYNASVQSNAKVTGNDQSQSFLYTYILMFLLYFAVIVYGQFVAQSVATEKSSRAMELLITSAKPVNLMFGKILGAGAAGFAQLAVLLSCAFGFYSANKQYWGENEMIASVFDMPLKLIVYTIVFFVLGFLIYSFMYGALASLASRLEDVSMLTMPITFVMIISFMVTMFSMLGNVDGVLMKIASFFPFSSPLAMFTRIAMGNVSNVEIAVSVILLVASTILIGYLAAAIYKIGVLMYGKPPKLNELSRALRNNKIN